MLWALGIGALAYLLGSVPFAVLVTRWRAGVDVRQVGSGHAGATNTMRAAGWGAGILVLLLDAAKGALAVAIPRHVGVPGWVMAFAAAGVVIGHCWPVFAGLRGGMGMASGAAALLVIWPFGLVLALGLGAGLQLLLRHSARANALTGLLVAALWLLAGAGWEAALAGALVGVIIAVRAFSDWRRVYRELWWDREDAAPRPPETD